MLVGVGHVGEGLIHRSSHQLAQMPAHFGVVELNDLFRGFGFFPCGSPLGVWLHWLVYHPEGLYSNVRNNMYVIRNIDPIGNCIF